MTIIMRPRVECDECGEQFDGGLGENALDLRTRLRRAGWSTPDSTAGFGQKDLCPACTKAKEFLRT